MRIVMLALFARGARAVSIPRDVAAIKIKGTSKHASGGERREAAVIRNARRSSGAEADAAAN